MPNYQKPNYLNGLRNNYINPVLPNIMLNNPNNIFNYNQPFKFQNMQNNYNFNQLYSKPNIIQNNIEKEIKPNFSEKKTNYNYSDNTNTNNKTNLNLPLKNKLFHPLPNNIISKNKTLTSNLPNNVMITNNNNNTNININSKQNTNENNNKNKINIIKTEDIIKNKNSNDAKNKLGTNNENNTDNQNKNLKDNETKTIIPKKPTILFKTREYSPSKDTNFANKKRKRFIKNNKLVFVQMKDSDIISENESINYEEKEKSLELNKNIKPRGSRFRGVSKNGSQWQVLIMVKKKKRYLGSFATEEEAARAYDKVALQHHGNKAKTNYDYTKEETDAIIKGPKLLKLD